MCRASRPLSKGVSVKRKNDPLYVAHNTFQFKVLEMSLPEPFEPRQTAPGEPTVDELLLPETMIRTNYDSGPYIVHRVFRYALSGGSPIFDGLFAWSVVCRYPDKAVENRDRAYLNEYVAVNGRIVKVFPNNDDEILIVDRENCGLQEKSGQMRLF